MSGHKTNKLLRFRRRACCFPTLHHKPWELLSLIYIDPCSSCFKSDPSQPGSVSAELRGRSVNRKRWMLRECLGGMVCIPSIEQAGKEDGAGLGDGVHWESADLLAAEGFAGDAV